MGLAARSRMTYKIIMTLESLAPNVWTAPVPNSFMGLQLGTRMTIVRLSDGSLFVHSPIRLDDDLKRQVDALGPVGHIVAPNLFHHLFVGDFASAYPEAKTHGARGLGKKRKDLTFDATLDGTLDPSWRDDLSTLKIDGCAFGETVFFHRPSGTLITADLFENFETSDHWPTRWYLKASGLHGTPGLSRFLRIMYRDKAKARRAIDRAIEWNPERITTAHGESIVANAGETLREAYGWLRA
jgi:hypothetical protein